MHDLLWAWSELTTASLAQLPAYFVSFISAYLAYLLVIWLGVNAMHLSPRGRLALFGVTLYGYLAGWIVPAFLLSISNLKLDQWTLLSWACMPLVTVLTARRELDCGWPEAGALGFGSIVAWLAAFFGQAIVLGPIGLSV